MEIDGGRYRLIRRLGAGGTGTVYQAADLVLGRTVAIKALHGSSDLDLLRREGRSLARVSHPNIVALHDLVEDHGRAYLVMEYVDGCTLEQWLEEHGPLPREQALAVFRQIAAAIWQAHATGLLHCDLKPANVLISAAGQVKLTDFTLAHHRAGDRFEGLAGGSADFAAPEQLGGGVIDPRTDVYGLGTLLRAMIGKLDSSSAAKRRVREVIARATADDPEERFAGVDEMLDALPPLRGGVTRIAAPSSLDHLTRVKPGVVRRERRRVTIPWRLTVLAAALIVAGAGVFTHLPASASPSTVALPDFVGAQRPSAELIARSLALRYHTILRYSSAVGAGLVADQSPAPGSKIERLGTVTLIVSEGPRPVAVPDVQGLSRDDAVARLRQSGFRVAINTEDTITHDSGEVLSQSPDPHVDRIPNSVVTITVSTKPWWWPF